MNLLAIDTSTERMSLALQQGDRVFSHQGLAGAQASSLVNLDVAVAGLWRMRVPRARGAGT